MGDQDQALILRLVNLFKLFHQHGKAPKVDSCLRLIKDTYLMLLCQHRGNLDPLALAAGKGGIHLPFQVLSGTQSNVAEQCAAHLLRQFPARRQIQKTFHRHSLKNRRLLERIADPRLCSFIRSHLCQIHPIQYDLSAAGRNDPHQYLCKRRFSSAVGSCDHQHFSVLYIKTHIPEKCHFFSVFHDFISQIFYLKHLIIILFL